MTTVLADETAELCASKPKNQVGFPAWPRIIRDPTSWGFG